MSNVTRIDDVRMSDIQPTKFGIELLADTIAESIKDGHTEPIAVAVKMTALEQLAKEVRDRIKDDVQSELSKHPKSKAEILGASVSQMDTIRYDYSHIAEWSELDAKIKELTERKKAIEDEEKKWRRGELPVISATSTFKVTLSK
jgi:hypothetical protein